jgi:DNA ligase D-like protein (predicted ligase)
MSHALDVLDAAARKDLRRVWHHGWREPMLATRAERRFSAENWMFERKLDGVRTLSIRDGGRPRLWSRNQKRVDACYPELAGPLATRGCQRFVADGEIVAFRGEQTSFARLRARIHLTGEQRVEDSVEDSGVDVYYYLFDLLVLDGFDLTGLALRDRKRVPHAAFDFHGPLRLCNHRDTEGEIYDREACRRGWEGLIAKRADSPYTSGRSVDWLKFKCVRDQEFVVGGFTDPQGSRQGFGALLVGYHEDGRLRYAGKVGTGYDNATLRWLRARMDGMRRESSPFDDPVREPTVHWIRPELVVEIGFSDWTRAGRLRHPRYTGLRNDKPAADVVRETR